MKIRETLDLEIIREKFHAALLGVTVGDALRAPFERMSVVTPDELENLETKPGQLRIAPVALACYRYPAQVASIATQSALITHTHTLAIEGAILLACAIAYLVQWEPRASFTSTRLLHLLEGVVTNPVYHNKLKSTETLPAGAGADGITDELGNGIAAHEAVPTALYAFLRNNDSFSKAVLFAISLGGDTVTIASMTGALCEGFLGETALATRWREEVEGGSYIRGLADALMILAVGTNNQNKN